MSTRGNGSMRQVEAAQAAGWSFHPTGDPEALAAARNGTTLLYLCAGRQVVTAGRLEVLALLTRDSFPTGLPLGRCIEAVQDSGALPVLPWGFGKWTFGRRALVESALQARRPPLFVGDNGGRWRLSPEPPLLRSARRMGVPVLPGTDPLPFRHEQERAGSYGFLADCALPAEAPATALREWLRSLDRTPPVYGTLARLPRFLYNQLAMQVGQRRSRRPSD